MDYVAQQRVPAGVSCVASVTPVIINIVELVFLPCNENIRALVYHSRGYQGQRSLCRTPTVPILLPSYRAGARSPLSCRWPGWWCCHALWNARQHCRSREQAEVGMGSFMGFGRKHTSSIVVTLIPDTQQAGGTSTGVKILAQPQPSTFLCRRANLQPTCAHGKEL